MFIQFKLVIGGTTEKKVQFQLLLDLPLKPDENDATNINKDKRMVFFAVHKGTGLMSEIQL